MQYRVLPMVLSLALTAGPVSSEIVTCPCGKPANATTTIEYNFKNCGHRYTQDTHQLAFCPILGAQRQNASGGWDDCPVQVQEIQVDTQEAKAKATVTFSDTGKYRLILSYTPFVYSKSDTLEIDSISAAKVVLFPPPDPLPLALIKPSDPSSGMETEFPGMEITFPNALPSVDPYEDLTNDNGTLLVECFTEPAAEVFVNDERGCFQGIVPLQSSPEGQARYTLINLVKNCGAF